jgi:catechol 2,3-dioxygenase-like lactoylglutathione lyase family enzyme
MRSLLVRVLCLWFGADLVLGLTGPAAASQPPASVSAVGCIELTVSDLDRSVEWYRRLLDARTSGAEREEVGEALEERTGVFAAHTRSQALAVGAECLELTEFLAQKGRPAPPDARSNDRWFQHVAVVVSDMDAAYARLRAAHVEHASSSPQRLPDWNPGAGGIRAFYFKDPDRHVLELIWFPPGKGDPRWQEGGAGRPLVLGIDHTAIAVEDTDRSLRFYRDALGLREAGRSENWGPEQARLNGLAGAHLRITQVRAPKGPGIEFLEYLAPRDGRSYPTDERASDLIHWNTILVVSDLAPLTRSLLAARAPLVSASASHPPGRPVRVRDPDGHVVELVQP